MSAPRHLLLTDLKPLAQLGVDGVVGAADLTQAMHDRIGGGAGRIARLVYGSIRAIARLAGVTADVAISALPERAATSSPERERVVAALIASTVEPRPG